MNQTEKRRAIALIKEREKTAITAVEADGPKLEIPKGITAKVDKIRQLLAEVGEAGFNVNTYGKVTVTYDRDHRDLVAARERREATKTDLRKRAERIELDIWSGRIEDFAEAEAQANALVGGAK